MTNKEASDLIEAALNHVLSSVEDYVEGDVLGDWIVVCHTANPDDSKGGSYPMFFSNGEMADYRAQGLLDIGKINLEWNLVSESKDKD